LLLAMIIAGVNMSGSLLSDPVARDHTRIMPRGTDRTH